MKHVLIRNPRLKGWEFGVLRALENEIISQTGAEIIELSPYGADPVVKRAGHGMRLDVLRGVLPKKKLRVEADVVWCILMCPENYELDLYTGWEHVPHRVVYIFDTLPPHFGLVRKIFSGPAFNLLVTSFPDAVPYLEELTGNRWHAVEQAVPADLFQLIEPVKKTIPFSSYGRRHAGFHQHLVEFCRVNNLYYDYSTHNAPNVWTDESELYRQYAWHMQHSSFTVSWPVEMTDPNRAGPLRPITCRWFEAAAAGTVIIGQAPGNPLFNNMLHPQLVVSINPEAGKKEVFAKLDQIWSHREAYQQAAYAIGRELGDQLTWKNRVVRLLALLSRKPVGKVPATARL